MDFDSDLTLLYNKLTEGTQALTIPQPNSIAPFPVTHFQQLLLCTSLRKDIPAHTCGFQTKSTQPRNSTNVTNFLYGYVAQQKSTITTTALKVRLITKKTLLGCFLKLLRSFKKLKILLTDQSLNSRHSRTFQHVG